ncbi:hypothetical protein BN3659_02460 [Alistipes sp. CHKCI003]|nr:hypothetical protein BN3659_02460 [Alistipes sp. CHKCI003]
MRFTKTNAPANGRAASWRMPRAGPANGPMPRCNARGPESAAPRRAGRSLRRYAPPFRSLHCRLPPRVAPSKAFRDCRAVGHRKIPNLRPRHGRRAARRSLRRTRGKEGGPRRTWGGDLRTPLRPSSTAGGWSERRRIAGIRLLFSAPSRRPIRRGPPVLGFVQDTPAKNERPRPHARLFVPAASSEAPVRHDRINSLLPASFPPLTAFRTLAGRKRTELAFVPDFSYLWLRLRYSRPAKSNLFAFAPDLFVSLCDYMPFEK